MKNITLITGAILLVTNILIGMVLTAYQPFNVVITSIVVAATTALIYSLRCMTLKDAFYISLTGIFSFIGIIAFVLGLFAPQQFSNNWYLIVIFLLIAIEAILLLIANKTSKIDDHDH